MRAESLLPILEGQDARQQGCPDVGGLAGRGEESASAGPAGPRRGGAARPAGTPDPPGSEPMQQQVPDLPQAQVSNRPDGPRCAAPPQEAHRRPTPPGPPGPNREYARRVTASPGRPARTGEPALRRPPAAVRDAARSAGAHRRVAALAMVQAIISQTEAPAGALVVGLEDPLVDLIDRRHRAIEPVVGEADGVVDDQPLDRVGILRGEPRGEHAAHRVADRHGLVDPLVLEDELRVARLRVEVVGRDLMHPLILQASDHAEDLSIHPLFHEHAAERLHQRTNPILGPIGEMVVQHQPLSEQRMRPPPHRVRLQPAVITDALARRTQQRQHGDRQRADHNRRSRRSRRDTCIDDSPIPKRMSLMSRAHGQGRPSAHDSTDRRGRTRSRRTRRSASGAAASPRSC